MSILTVLLISLLPIYYLGFFIAACEAASLAIGTLYGEQDTYVKP